MRLRELDVGCRYCFTSTGRHCFRLKMIQRLLYSYQALMKTKQKNLLRLFRLLRL